MEDFKAESCNLEPEVSSNSTTDDNESNEEYIVLDLHNANDLKQLDEAFGKIQSALDEQRSKLAAKWRCKTEESQSDESDAGHDRIRLQGRLLIDLQCILARISRIGMLEGKKYQELENEQNKAIAKLQAIVGLEEDARVASDKALQLAKETELEMKEIDHKREIIANKLKHAEPELAAARLAVTDIDDRALNELLSLKKPPRTVTNVLTVAVWIVNSASNPNTCNNNNNSNKNKKKLSKSKNKKNRSRAQSQSINVSLTQSALNPIDESSAKVKASPRQATVRPQSAKTGSKRSRGRSQSRNSFGGAGITGVTTVATTESRSRSNSQTGSGSRSRSRSRSNSQSKGSKRNSQHMNKIDKLKSRDVDKILTQSWSDTRVMLTRGNFKKSVLEFEPKSLPKYVFERIEKEFLVLEDFTVLRANQASKVLGPLVKWILSIIGYTTIWYSLEPMAEQVSQLEAALKIKQIELIKVKNIAKESQAKVIEIRTEMLRMVGYHKIGDLYFLS